MRWRREDFPGVGISVLRQNDLEASHGCTSSSLLVPAAILLEFKTSWVEQRCSNKPQDEYFKAIIAPIDVPLPCRGLGYSPCFTNAQIPTAHNRSNISGTANCSASKWSPVAGFRKKSKKSREVLWLCGRCARQRRPSIQFILPSFLRRA